MPNAESSPERLAVQAIGLFKTYDDVAAVSALSLDVPPGSFCGLVGPNGAGKSTTIGMLTGLLRPDFGRVVVAGVDVWLEPVAAKQRMGVLPEDLRLFERLTGAEMLGYLGRLREMPADEVTNRSNELLDLLDLDADSRDKLVMDYSTGMRKKIALAAALLHAPPVLFLDEPFESVDPVSVRTIRTVLERFTAAGGTIVFSSHVMAVVEALCDRVVIMARGNVVAQGTTADVTGGAALEDVFVELVGAPDSDDGGLAWLRPSYD